MEKMKAALQHIYGYFTDNENEGDFMKMAGAFLMIVSVVRFAASQGFDPMAFGAGAGAFAASKTLDVIKEKGKEK
jgi:hypothetical protein